MYRVSDRGLTRPNIDFLAEQGTGGGTVIGVIDLRRGGDDRTRRTFSVACINVT
jgi:hypothetical protein